MREPLSNAARRPDSLFGVCAAIGEDFGFNPDVLRIAITASLLWDPAVVLCGYAFAGMVVLASRSMFPVLKRAAPPAVTPNRDDHPVEVAPTIGSFQEDVPLARAA